LRGYSSDWRIVRVHALRRDNYLCVACLRDGIATLALDVDHITPITTAPDRRLDLTNLQSLCRPCHVTKTRREQSGTPADHQRAATPPAC
jgi:5-methylcytosine-specific restriction protein A